MHARPDESGHRTTSYPDGGPDVYVRVLDVPVQVTRGNTAEMFNPDSHIPGYGAKNGHSGAA
jgi:hypothetical protein